jgi:outer membrane protein assembly factor BamE (lipoprotein component of BamABCDE complex)
VFRLTHGSYPLGKFPGNKIEKGMTAGEVEAILGAPHNRRRQGEEERWYYWLDSFGTYWFAVCFGPDGRVVSTHGN